ncbi:membrane protein insertase YidC [Demequina sp.]|uniref:membrane protein insertase YidC n=1 Tax=Demequina sp. TaxID=2050685 RepID=UPI0025BE892F|nr:membrane protein insertase YidC [Demequina sp.]
MEAIFSLLVPIEWVVASVMALVHQGLEFLGMDPESGVAWALSIVGLTAVIRMALIPVFVRQIKAQRSMQVIAPDLRKIQDKYKGKKDQASREAMTKETMALYSEHKTNPFASCLPLLLQMPIFFSLFRVLNYRLKEDGEAIGLLSEPLRQQAMNAELFGAKLSDTFLGADASATRWIAAVLIAMMVSTTFFSQRQLTFKNMPASALEGPMAQQQKILLYALPFIFVISGPNFPIGVLIYWTVSNAWSMGQQFYVIRRNPTPGSEAEKALIARKTEKAARKGLTIDGRTLEEARAEEEAAAAAAEEERRNRQRQQPKRKKGKKGGAKPGQTGGASKPGGANAGDSGPGPTST